MEGKTISWKYANGIMSGEVIGNFYRKIDKEFLGYLVQMANGKRMIVHPKSIIYGNDKTDQKL